MPAARRAPTPEPAHVGAAPARRTDSSRHRTARPPRPTARRIRRAGAPADRSGPLTRTSQGRRPATAGCRRCGRGGCHHRPTRRRRPPGRPVAKPSPRRRDRARCRPSHPAGQPHGAARAATAPGRRLPACGSPGCRRQPGCEPWARPTGSGAWRWPPRGLLAACPRSRDPHFHRSGASTPPGIQDPRSLSYSISSASSTLTAPPAKSCSFDSSTSAPLTGSPTSRSATHCSSPSDRRAHAAMPER